MRRVLQRILYHSGNVNGMYIPHLPLLRPARALQSQMKLPLDLTEART